MARQICLYELWRRRTKLEVSKLMSYCRFIEADAYIYDDVYYGLYCSACSLMPLKEADMSAFGIEEKFFINESFAAGYDYEKMLEHISEHRRAGDYIPEDVDERLKTERDCKHSWNEKGYCSGCWANKESYERLS